MGDQLALSYLEGKIGPLLGSHARDGVLQYLASFDVSQPHTERDMIAYLEELLGRNPKYTTIVKQYIRMRKTFSHITAPTASAAPSASGEPGKKGRNKGKGGSTGISSDAGADSKVEPKTCNCMAMRHALRGSCAGCGMIYCAESNNLQCSHCQDAVRAPMTAEDARKQGLPEKTIAAYAQKDKLLMFDKENAKRTAVHDAQADYYQSTSWMSEEERAAAKAKDAERSEARKASRLRKPISVSFDIAGRKFTEDVKGLNINEGGSEVEGSEGAYHRGREGMNEDEEYIEGDDRGGVWSPSSSVDAGLENWELAAASGSRAADIYRDLKARLMEKYKQPEDIQRTKW